MTKRSILIVDDEPIITRVFSKAFSKDPFNILIEHDGKKGFQTIVQKHPDLILLDVMMPGLTGLEVLEKMKEAEIQIPVILMTAYGDTQTEKRAKELGISAYLTKPFDSIDDVIALIKSKLPH